MIRVWVNEVRDIIPATLPTEVCHGVTTEPHLQPESRVSPCVTALPSLKMVLD